MPSRSRRRHRVLLAGGLALILSYLLAPAGVVVLVRHLDGAFARADLLSPGARAGDLVAGPLTFLIIGSDQRAQSPSAGERADTIIMVHVPRGLDRAYLISIPRDLYVRIPPDPATGFRGDRARINAAFDYGQGGVPGTTLLSRTLTDLVGVRFAGAAVVRFEGLKQAVDVLGGVRMCVDVRTVSVHTGRVFEVGCRVMNSVAVLDYLRQRDFADGDFTRQRHQQQFLKAILDRAEAAGMLADPGRFDAVMRSVADSVTLDTGGRSVPDLVLSLRAVRPDRLTGVQIPYEPAAVGDQSVVVATGDAAGLFAAIRSDTLDAWATAHPRWVNRI